MCFRGKTFKSRFLCPFFFLLSSFLSLSSSLSLSLSPSPSLSLSCGFFLDRVLADVKNGFVIFEMQKEIL